MRAKHASKTYINTQANACIRIHRGDYSFPSPFWDNISDSAKDLVRKMLVVDPRKRLSATDCLKHEWIQNASRQETCNFGSQHKAFLLIRRLPLFEQVL
jgi:serine/threonine protein kinase